MTDTLLDMAQTAFARHEIKRGAICELLASSPLLRELPFVDATGGEYSYPDYELRAPEVLKIAGGDLDVNLDEVGQAPGRRATLEAGMVRNLSRFLNRVLINGVTSKDPRDPNGLFHRVTVKNTIDGGVTSKTLTQGLKLIPRATHLLIAGTTIQQGRFQVVWDKDAFGNRVPSFGWMDDEQGYLTPIILAGLDEHAEPIQMKGAFVLRLGEDGVHGVQNGAPQVDDLGSLAHAPILRTRIEWLINLADHPDSIAYITG